MALLLCSGAVGCADGGSRSHTVPWNPDETRVIDDDRGVYEVGAAEGDQCLDLESGTKDLCIKPQTECGDKAADVVLDAKGELIEIICYPAAETLSVEELDAQEGMIAQNQNNSVIALDDEDDGVDIAGDVSVDANNVVIYGEDPRTSVIEGDVDVDGNNIIVRGVHIQGDVSIVANNAFFYHCVVDGNVTVAGNNAVFVGCDVLGNVTITGHNSHVAGNRIVGKLEDEGKNTRCEDNVSATDANADGVIEASELGAVLSCG
jgi:cytoskeletal protein CcmA (bactofilin family)